MEQAVHGDIRIKTPLEKGEKFPPGNFVWIVIMALSNHIIIEKARNTIPD
jgi:hypothetical protein